MTIQKKKKIVKHNYRSSIGVGRLRVDASCQSGICNEKHATPYRSLRPTNNQSATKSKPTHGPRSHSMSVPNAVHPLAIFSRFEARLRRHKFQTTDVYGDR